MDRQELTVTVRDKGRVTDAIQRARGSWRTYSPALDSLQAELRRADVVAPWHVPDDVITMNSRFELTNMRTGHVQEYTLVYPEDESLPEGRISVLSAAGTALLGARAGAVVRWCDEEGARLMVVRAIRYQPEAEGHMHL